jgi:hypothetical protein
VWSSFDSRRNAKASDGANDKGGDEAGEPDMFGSAGVAAE